MRTTYPRYRQFSAENIEAGIARLQSIDNLLKSQLDKSCAMLHEWIGTEKYLAWVDEQIDDTDSLGMILRKIDDYLAELAERQQPKLQDEPLPF